MKAPLSWLAAYADLAGADLAGADLAGADAWRVADALLRIGIEVEHVVTGADRVSGPVVLGRVLSLEAEPQKNGKTIRWCQVDAGVDAGGEPRGIVCGAANFAVGDLVVVALPGSVLPGDFAISRRKTYGHQSDGMICSARELGLGDEHDGILVLPPDVGRPGDDALTALGMRDAVLDVAVTTDRGYCLSIRGLAREAATACGVAFTDVSAHVPEPDGRVYDVAVDDPAGCDRFSARAVTGLDPTAPTPGWMARRLQQCGMRSISLAVDVTNYVMLETGQPLHAFDRTRLTGAITARRAHAGETLRTLDGSIRALDPQDMVVADGSGAIALAGVMGGASTEIGAGTTDIVLEAAHWDPDSVARTVRRHALPSEAARRFERGVDPEIAGIALARCVDLLVAHGGATPVAGYTVVGTPAAAPPILLPAAEAQAVAGMPIPPADAVAHLRAVGCTVIEVPDDVVTEVPDDVVTEVPDGMLQVQPPPWRPDLTLGADLVEEIVRLAGYHLLPSVLPPAPAGGGLTARQVLMRAVSRAVAAAGFVEVLSYPFVAPDVHALLRPADGIADAAPPLRLVNPLSADEPELRTTLLPGLVATVLRNLGRGARDLAIYEVGQVFLARAGGAMPPQTLGMASRPSDEQLAALDAALPAQPRHLAAILCGAAEPAGWWGPARPASWADAVEAAQVVAGAARAHLDVRAAQTWPWHPGRCAALMLDDVVLGHAGELHPRVVQTLGLPPRTCAMELDLDALPVPEPAVAPAISGYPPVLLDVALVVGADVPAADLTRVLRDNAGPLLESLRLFDVYTDDERLGRGLRSIAFSLRFRAPDRTLTVEDATAARDAAVQAAEQTYGARLRS